LKRIHLNFEAHLLDERDDQTEALILDQKSDIPGFINQLLYILLKKHWILGPATNIAKNVIYEHIHRVIFHNKTHQFLSLSYSKLELNKRQDTPLNEKMALLRNNNMSLQHLQVSSKYEMIGTRQPFRRTLFAIKQMQSKTCCTVNEKLRVLESCMKLIGIDAQEYWREKEVGKYRPQDLLPGADDLLPIFIYCVVWANVRDLHAMFNYMCDYVDESLLKGMFDIHLTAFLFILGSGGYVC